MISKSFDKFYFKNDLNLTLELGKASSLLGAGLETTGNEHTLL